MSKRSTSPRLLLERVGLQRFKAAYDAKDIPLGPFTVIIGPNGSGKSTLVEALQWLDTTLRWHAAQASDRFRGIHDVINVRSRPLKNPRSFEVSLSWGEVSPNEELEDATEHNVLSYELRVDETREGAPSVHSERLHQGRREYIATRREGTFQSAGERALFPNDKKLRRTFDEPDRLALGRIGREHGTRPRLKGLQTFWERAVFLRLSPNRLAGQSSAYRPSNEPLLDEEGRTLPALLASLKPRQRDALVEQLGELLPNIQGLVVDKSTGKRDDPIGFSLLEKHPTGHAGLGRYPIPAPLLSEGTRRLTALIALLVHEPPPSFLCIEEVENGLDPKTTIKVLQLLRSAAKETTQVVVTTHSPWLLDHVDWDQIVRVKRENGETTYSRFRTEAAAKSYQQRGLPPGAAYVNEE
jgi:predicted ATPase